MTLFDICPASLLQVAVWTVVLVGLLALTGLGRSAGAGKARAFATATAPARRKQQRPLVRTRS